MIPSVIQHRQNFFIFYQLTETSICNYPNDYVSWYHRNIIIANYFNNTCSLSLYVSQQCKNELNGHKNSDVEYEIWRNVNKTFRSMLVLRFSRR
jgi:hypothetical protein